MDGLKDAFWVTASTVALVLGILDQKLQEYAARKCREYLAYLAEEA
jgi:hypothetical protein